MQQTEIFDQAGEKQVPDIKAIVVPATNVPAVTDWVVVVEQSTMKLIANLAAREKALAQVTNGDEANAASAMLQEVTDLGIAIEKSRKEAKDPFWKVGTMIDTAAKEPKADLDTLKASLKTKLRPYNLKVEEERRVAEAQKKAEEERLAKEQRDAEEALLKAQQAAELAAQQAREAQKAARIAALAPKTEAPPKDDTPAPMQASAGSVLRSQLVAQAAAANLKQIKEQRREAPKAIVAAAPPKVLGLATTVTLTPSLVDISRVPETYLKPREVDWAVVRKVHCTGWKDGQELPQVPGLLFEVKRDVRSS